MAIEPEQFMRYWRFSAPPFPAATAEQERATLTPVFLAQPWFRDEVVGDPQRPQSCVVYAEGGMGKSAHRLELERMAGVFHGEPALVVVVDERAAMPQGTAGELAYVEWLCRLTLLQLDVRLRQQPAARAALQRESPRSYDLLWLYMACYAREGTYDLPPPSPQSELLRGQLSHRDGPIETLRRLADLIRALKYASVYVLFDSLDEGLQPDELPALADRLRPLTGSRRLLHNSGFAFKFFLPTVLRPLLNGDGGAWPYRMPEHTISYSAAQLRQILSRRLEVSSRYGATIDESYVNSFAQLCAPASEPEDAQALGLEALLIAAAGGSPRTLLRLARRAIELHCALARQPGEPISRAAIMAAIEELCGPGYWPTIAPLQPVAPPPEPAPGPPRPGLPVGQLRFFDDGRVEIGGAFVTRLSGKLYKAMQILWESRGHLVRYDAFEAEIYRAERAERADPKSSREKLIRRLRAKIEQHNPEASASRTYIDVTEGIGLFLSNYCQGDE